jgi:hypothetical protein
MKYPLLHPTHVISGSISASEASSPRAGTPPADGPSSSSLNVDNGPAASASRSSTIRARTAPIRSAVSPIASLEPSRTGSPSTHVASLSLSHPVDLVEFDAEHDLQVISPPSSRASSHSRTQSDDLDARFSLSSDDEHSRSSSRLSMTEGSEMFFSVHENATSTGTGSVFSPPSRTHSTNSFSGLTTASEDDVISVASGEGSEIFSESGWSNVGSSNGR